MKPFDLERAKAGDPITTKDGAAVHFVGTTKTGTPVVERAEYVEVWLPAFLCMAPKATTYYVNVYRSIVDDQLSIGCILHTSEADAAAVSSDDATYIKTISFEVDE
jgi:hypothetical protein